MQDLAFYKDLGQPPGGIKRLVVPVRRALRKLLLPIFQRQVAILQAILDRLDRGDEALADLARRHEDLVDQSRASVALGWDYVATVRRLAVLEDRVEELLARPGIAPGEGPSIAFPDRVGSNAAESKAV